MPLLISVGIATLQQLGLWGPVLGYAVVMLGLSALAIGLSLWRR